MRVLRGAFVLSIVCGSTPDAIAQVTTADLKMLSLEELANIEVTSVSKQPEKLRETASGIQIITGEQIRRSGAGSLPEALRLAPNLRVAQLNAYAWVVTARGFSGVFANKLLVLIDGRSVYTPLFAGVLWDGQNPMIEHIDRIEVISGPGGTLWGANAVNGVINVITKSASETTGTYASGTGGSFIQGAAEVRHGGSVGEHFAWRAFAQHTDRANSATPAGGDAADAWTMSQVGVRADWRPTAADAVTILAAAYVGREQVTPSDSTLNGQHVLGRWTHAASSDSETRLQVYFDRAWRDDVPSTVTDELLTTDVDLQHHRALGARHRVVGGAGYRLMQDDTRTSTPFLGFVPRARDMHLFNVFGQDEVALVPARLKLTLGTKLEHNSFSGFELQPNARLAWIPSDQRMVWGAVSRAVRSPSRIDVDYHIPARIIEIGTPGVNGGPDFDAEKLVAYELGFRAQPAPSVSLSVAAFYNAYDDLYSVESVGGTPTYQIENGTRGESWGIELAEAYQPATRWRLQGGYTFFHKELWSKPGHSFDASSLGNDPGHQVVLQSSLDLPQDWRFDVVTRVVSSLPNPAVPAYATADIRLAKTVKRFELSLVGQNLGQSRHSEFGVQHIRRSVYARVTWRRP